MKLGPVIHGGLLVVALGLAYQVHTHKGEDLPKRGTHAVWELGNLSEIVLESETKRVRIAQREDENGSYYWGQVVRTAKLSSSTTREFPIGRAGEELMQQYQSLMALRELGALRTAELEKYHLDAKTLSFTAREAGGVEHALLFSHERIYGGTDRYALHVSGIGAGGVGAGGIGAGGVGAGGIGAGGVGYVLSGKLIQPLESAESSLGLKRMHTYDKARVTSITIRTTAGDNVLVKRSAPDGGEGWEYETTPGASDALASLLERVGKLKPTKYEPEMAPSSLVHIATLRYRNTSKDALGFLELYRQPVALQSAGKSAGAVLRTQYYIRTERTRVLAKVGRLDADRVDQDLVELFGIAAPSTRPAPAPPPTRSER